METNTESNEDNSLKIIGQIKFNESIEDDYLEKDSLDINDLIEEIKSKISNLEKIDEKIVQQICMCVKKIQKDHNNKIDNWYDDKYYFDMNIFNKNNIDFCKLTEFYNKNSFVIVEK